MCLSWSRVRVAAPRRVYESGAKRRYQYTRNRRQSKLAVQEILRTVRRESEVRLKKKRAEVSSNCFSLMLSFVSIVCCPNAGPVLSHLLPARGLRPGDAEVSQNRPNGLRGRFLVTTSACAALHAPASQPAVRRPRFRRGCGFEDLICGIVSRWPHSYRYHPV